MPWRLKHALKLSLWIRVSKLTAWSIPVQTESVLIKDKFYFLVLSTWHISQVLCLVKSGKKNLRPYYPDRISSISKHFAQYAAKLEFSIHEIHSFYAWIFSLSTHIFIHRCRIHANRMEYEGSISQGNTTSWPLKCAYGYNSFSCHKNSTSVAKTITVVPITYRTAHLVISTTIIVQTKVLGIWGITQMMEGGEPLSHKGPSSTKTPQYTTPWTFTACAFLYFQIKF